MHGAPEGISLLSHLDKATKRFFFVCLDRWDNVFFLRYRINKKTEMRDRDDIYTGQGTTKDPFRKALRDTANSSGCLYCPVGFSCSCVEFQSLVDWATATVHQRRVCGRRDKNSKSIKAPFVADLCRHMSVQKDDVLYELGSANGSVAMQIACVTGATVVAVEIQEANHDLAVALWAVIQPEWEKRHPTRPAGRIIFRCEDMCGLLRQQVAEPIHLRDGTVLPCPTVAWFANLLMSGVTNSEVAEALVEFRDLRGFAAMRDIYPHERGGAMMKRNPKPYVKFTSMLAYEWQPGTVEWSHTEVKPFYVYLAEKAAAVNEYAAARVSPLGRTAPRTAPSSPSFFVLDD